jgi:hypothetical protein
MLALRPSSLALPVPVSLSRSRPVRVSYAKRKHIITRSSVEQTAIEVSHYVGKGLILWVGFTAGLNWLYYHEQNKKKDNDK